MKYYLLLILLFAIVCCNKEPVHSNSPVRSIGSDQIQPQASSNQKVFVYAIDSDKWVDYPYIGHDGDTTEIRMFFHTERLLLDPAYYKDAKNIKSVVVKSLHGELLTAPLWISVGPNDSGYVYAIGNTGISNQFTLWWIQKPPYKERPSADSIFIVLQ